MFKKYILTLSVLSALFIAGCSGGGGSDGGISGNPGAAAGKVYYPGLLEARVCVDDNNNNYADDGEKCADVSPDGGFDLGDYDKNKPLVAVIMEEDNNAPKNISSKSGVLDIKNILTPPAGMLNISVFTTYIKSAMDGDPSLDDASAEKRIKSALNLNEDTKLSEIPADNALLIELSQKSAEIFGRIKEMSEIKPDIMPGVMAVISNLTLNSANRDKPAGELVTADTVKEIAGISENIKLAQSAEVMTALDFLNKGEAVYGVWVDSVISDDNISSPSSEMKYISLQKRGDKLFGNALFNFPYANHEGFIQYYNNISVAETYLQDEYGHVGQQYSPFANFNYRFNNETQEAVFYESDKDGNALYDVRELIPFLHLRNISVVDLPDGREITTATMIEEQSFSRALPVTMQFPAGSKKFIFHFEADKYPFEKFTAFDELGRNPWPNEVVIAEGDGLYDLYYYGGNNPKTKFKHENGNQLILIDTGTYDFFTLYNIISRETAVYDASCIGFPLPMGFPDGELIVKEECRLPDKPKVIVSEVESRTHPQGVQYWRVQHKWYDGEFEEDIFFKDEENMVMNLYFSIPEYSFNYVFFNRTAIEALELPVSANP